MILISVFLFFFNYFLTKFKTPPVPLPVVFLEKQKMSYNEELVRYFCFFYPTRPFSFFSALPLFYHTVPRISQRLKVFRALNAPSRVKRFFYPSAPLALFWNKHVFKTVKHYQNPFSFFKLTSPKRASRNFFFIKKQYRVLGGTPRRPFSAPSFGVVGQNSSSIFITRPVASNNPLTPLRSLESSTLPFIFLSLFKKNKRSLISKTLWEFRSKTSRLLNADLKRTVINYNLKPLKSRIEWLYGNRSLAAAHVSTFFKNGLDLQTPNSKWQLGKPGLPFLNIRGRYYQNSFRRMTTYWVSKINQRTLTPVRREFNRIHSRKEVRYQYRLTVEILKYYQFRVLEYVNFLELTLLNIVSRAKLVSSRSLSNLFIRKGSFLVNGMTVFDPLSIVSPLDVISAPTNINFILFLKWHSNILFYSVKKFYYYLKIWRLRMRRPFPKQSSFRIPNWVRKFVIYRESHPIFLEIDFVSMSIINLFNPLLMFNHYHYLSFNLSAPASFRGLNWKSLT